MVELPELRFTPAVFAVGEQYQIITYARSEILLSVRINGKEYSDHSNGILRSLNRIHKVLVPIKELDRAREYTVCYRRIIERKPYFPTTEEPVEATFRFYPVRADGNIRIYQLSDTHGEFSNAAKAAGYFGDEIDLLVLNGDILDHSGRIENFDLIYRFCETITKGEHPCVFSRGNHDLRGIYAEKLADYTPTRNGASYYTFRLGRLWGMVLDCGEDKPDSHAEYGYTVACHTFREEETEYLKHVIRNAEKEYLAEGVEYRMIVSHVPFSYINVPPFDIEKELYAEWLRLIKEQIQPHIMLSGHLHALLAEAPGGKLDSHGLQPCPVFVSGCAVPDANGKHIDFIGGAVTLEEKQIECCFTNCSHGVRERKAFSLES